MEGTFTGRPVSWGITETQAGLPQAVVKFEVDTLPQGDKPAGKVHLTWFGSFKEGRAQEITLDALLTLGYKSKGFSDFANGEGLSKDDVSLVVEEVVRTGSDGEPALDQNNKKIHDTRIRFINALSGGEVKGKLAAQDAVMKLKGMNLDAALAMRMNEKGIRVAPKTQTQTSQASNDASFSPDDVPF